MVVVVGSTPCPRCGSFDRYVNKGGNSCGGCARAAQRKWVARNPEKDRAIHRAIYERNRERITAQHKCWKIANIEKVREYARRAQAARSPEDKRAWKTRQPEVRRAGVRLLRAEKKGLVIRPDYCSQCGVSCRPEAAHHDYDKPLDVRWLCTSCHRAWDRAEPKSAYSRLQRGVQ